MLVRVLRLLVCPFCKGPLDRDVPSSKVGGRVRNAALVCRQCQRPFAIEEGIGLLAAPVAPSGAWHPDAHLLSTKPSETYWRAYLKSLPPGVEQAYDRGIAEMVEAVRDLRGLLVDLVTCRGHVLQPLAAATGAQQLLLGTDPELSRLYATQAAIQDDRNYTRVSLMEMDGAHWPIREGSAVGATSFYGSSLMPDGRRMLHEASRALREDAPFVFTSLLTQEDTLTLRQAARRRHDELLTEKRLRAALQRAGFVIDRWEVLVEGDAWPRTPYEPIPLEGDPWQHVIVHARRRIG